MVDYQDLLRTAARDFAFRGWKPIPIQHKNGSPIPPVGWAESSIDYVWKDQEIDALAVHIGSTQLCWIDLDSKQALAMASNKLKAQPYYDTLRGRQYLVRLISPITRTLNLRKFGIEGELRAGKCFSIMPPSKHRSGKGSYKWRIGLPETDAEIPALDIQDLFKIKLKNVEKYVQNQKTPPKYTHYVSRGLGDLGTPFSDSIHHCNPRSSLPETVLRNCIARTLPKRKGLRLEMLPAFVRLLVASGYKFSSADIKQAAMEWWKAASRQDVTNDRTGEPTVSAIEWLFKTYDKNRSSLPTWALEKMHDVQPVTSATAITENPRSQERYVTLATFCLAMEIVAGGCDFFLSCRDAAKMLDVSPRTANKMLKDLAAFGYIEIVHNGTPGVQYNGKARTMRCTELTRSFNPGLHSTTPNSDTSKPAIELAT